MLFKNISTVVLIILIFSCKSKTAPSLSYTKKIAIDTLELKIDSLKAVAQPGDLILRLGDDMLSYSIRFLSERDKAFSHAGIVVEKNGLKMVCHIAPGEQGADTAFYEPLDSFINSAKNLLCALYRYNLNDTEKNDFLKSLDQSVTSKTKFDKLYDLKTDGQMYCSEMIAKALQLATNKRIVIKKSRLPKGMQPLMVSYLKDIPKEEIMKRPYISLDNLYLNANCTPVARFSLIELSN